MNTKNPFNKEAGNNKPENLATLILLVGKKERKVEINLDVIRQEPSLKGMDNSALTIIALSVAKAIYSVGEKEVKAPKTEAKK